MKSLFWSILIIVIVFTAIKLNILIIFDGHALFYTAIIGFACVIGCALYFVGLPKNDSSADLPKNTPFSFSTMLENAKRHAGISDQNSATLPEQTPSDVMLRSTEHDVSISERNSTTQPEPTKEQENEKS